MSINLLEYKQVVISELTKDDLGKAVMVDEKWDKQYGIITGFTKQHVAIHFARSTDSCLLKRKTIYFVKLKNN